jgi:hypothetical protein
MESIGGCDLEMELGKLMGFDRWNTWECKVM